MITTETINRPWGYECRFHVVRDGYPDINETLALTTVDEDPTDRINAYIAKVDARNEAPVGVPSVTLLVSRVDLELIRTKTQLKDFVMTYIKTNPSCTLEDLVQAVTSEFAAEDASMLSKLITIYVGGSYNLGYISTPEFSAFRDWVVATPVEILKAI